MIPAARPRIAQTVLLLLAAAGFALSAAAAAAQGLPEGWSRKWVYDLEQSAASPTLFPDADRPEGVVVCASTEVVLLDETGKAVWTYAPEGRPASPAAVADIHGDGSPEVLLFFGAGGIVCLDAHGTEKWRRVFGTPGSGFSVPVAADVHPSEGLEVLFGYDDGWLRCLSAKGETLWEFYGDRFRVGGIAVGDIDADGEPEVVYGTDNGHVYCLNGWGQVEWRFNELAPYGRSGPNLADLNNDGVPEVLITRSNVNNNTCLIAIDGKTGALLWRTRDVMQGYVSNAVVDLSGTGQWVVLHGDKGNNLYCENADGSRQWHALLAGRGLFWAPAVADIDGDGYLEILAGVRGEDPETKACLYVVGQDGTIDERLDIGNDANVGPAVGDIDGDGTLDIIVVTQNPNQVQCLTRNAGGRVGWPSLRGNSQMTARTANVPAGAPGRAVEVEPAGVVTLDFDAVFLGENVWRLSWNEPAPDGAFVELSTVSEGGSRRAKVFDLKEGATQLEAHWDLVHPGVATVTVRMFEGTSRTPRFAAVRNVQPLEPEFCEFARVETACRDAIQAGTAAHADTRLIEMRLTALASARDAAAALAKTGAAPEAIAQEATRLRRQSAQLERLARTLRAFWREGGSGNFVFWEDGNPWDDFDPLDLPAKLDMEKPIQFRAFKNEYEDAAITLFNITAEPIDVRCVFTEPNTRQVWYKPEDPLARNITLRRLLPIGAAWTDRVFDPLPELDRSRSITIPPGEGRQVWLVARTHDLSPGTHDLTFFMGSLTKPPVFREAAVQIEVWPVSLPTDVFAKINWSNLEFASVSDQALEYMLQMGLSVSYGPGLPQIPVDAQGNLAGVIDWAQFDSVLDRAPRYWTFLWGAPPARKWPEGVTPSEDSPEYFNGFRTAVRELAYHLNAKGVDYHYWAFYPMDEPWNTGFTGIPELKKFCEMVKKADPNAQVYADPCGLVRVEYLDEFKGLIDIWQPELNVLKRDPKLVKWFQANSKRFWFYEAPGPAKNLLPLGHYRAFGWYSRHFGTEGCGYWVYKSLDDWWVTEADYSVVYQTNEDTVATRRSEADRDGVEDYRAFHVLDHEIRNARLRGYASEADAAEALTREAIESVIGWNLRNIDEITRATRDYEIDFELVLKYREKVKDEILRLRALLAAR